MGKGSKQRPSQVDREKVQENWDIIFNTEEISSVPFFKEDCECPDCPNCDNEGCKCKE